MIAELHHQNAMNDFRLLAYGQRVYLQHHRPGAMHDPYHVHPSIEINYLQGCDMTYSFGGDPVCIPDRRFCIFWAAQAHRVLEVSGKGKITNAYISLEEFWKWPLPKDFVDILLGGAVIIADQQGPMDDLLAERWAAEVDNESDTVDHIHCLEIQSRMTRLALEGWQAVSQVNDQMQASRVGGNAILHFDKMLRFISVNFSDPITLGDVADAASVSKNYANTLFKKITGTTVKAHITNVRVFRARMMLAETDSKIVNIALDSGFRSLSSFYEAFQKHMQVSPAQFRRARENNWGSLEPPDE